MKQILEYFKWLNTLSSYRTVSFFNNCAVDLFFDVFYFKRVWSSQFYEGMTKNFTVFLTEIFPCALLNRILSIIHNTALTQHSAGIFKICAQMKCKVFKQASQN